MIPTDRSQDRCILAIHAPRVLLLALLAAPGAAQTPLAFSKSFAPGTIGPGSTSALTFTISAATAVTDLAFTDTLPAALTFADPASATLGSGCDPATSVSAPDGGATLSFSSPRLGAGETCTVRVDVTGTSPGTHTNTSSDLTSSAGTSGPAVADLVIDTSRPGFSKGFSPESVAPGGTTRLTFTIDGSQTDNLPDLSFSDDLPAGTSVATTPNVTNSCNGTVSAPPGATTISLFSGSLDAESTCEIGVDVTVEGGGTFVNRSGVLSTSAGDAGFAVDEVTAALDPIGLTKRFLDPVPPGATTDLEFTLRNSTRETATDISFTDDLEATLTGLEAALLPLQPCGSGSSITGTSLLTFVGGTLASGDSCTFSVRVEVPAGAATGSYLNTTSPVSADVGAGEPSFFAPAADNLDVLFVPVLTKELSQSQVDDGETITATFTILNTHPTDQASDLQFEDDLNAFLPGTDATPDSQNGVCGPGSAFTETAGVLALTGGNLAAGESCTFTVDLVLPDRIPSGTYVNRTSPVLATIGEVQVTGTRGEAQVTRAGAPVLTKTFLDPVGPGDTVDLVFTLDASESTEDFTEISFTDDLEATLSGLAATVRPLVPCGPGSALSGDSLIEITGASLPAGDSCSFTVTLQVPADAAPGSYPNTTSAVTATAGGETVLGDPAVDDLDVSLVDFQKQFLDDPAVPGGTVTLGFLIQNLSPDPLAKLTFTDGLDAVLPGLAPVDTPQSDVCGAGSTLTFDAGVLELAEGSLPGGGNCIFQTVLQVPASVGAGELPNTTSTLSGTVGGEPFSAPPATDRLVVGPPLSLSKSFTDDPAGSGGTVTLSFTITNLSPDLTATDLSFTDDLGAALPGLAATGLPAGGVCGPGSEISGTTVLTLTGGTLAPGAACTFAVILQVPGDATGTFTNVTGDLAAELGGEPVTAPGAEDDLEVTAVRFTKSFSGDVEPGGTVILTFTIENFAAGAALANLSFTDDLEAVVPGLAAVGTPLAGVCGPGSLLTGSSALALTGASVPPASACTFEVSLDVPPGAAAGTFTNVSSPLAASASEIAPPAVGDLEVVRAPSVLEIPTLGQWGLLLLAGLVAALGWYGLRG